MSDERVNDTDVIREEETTQITAEEESSNGSAD